MTKLYLILNNRKMSQRDLQRAIQLKHNILIGDDRISKMVNGVLTNYHTNTAQIIADTLELKIDDIIENIKPK
jgi:DNA-binding Xre family transcriptional regulator